MSIPWVTHKAGCRLPREGRPIPSFIEILVLLSCLEDDREYQRKLDSQPFSNGGNIGLLSQGNYNYEGLIQTAAARKSKVKVKKKKNADKQGRNQSLDREEWSSLWTMQHTRSYRDPHSKRFSVTEAKIIPCVFIEMGGKFEKTYPIRTNIFSIQV